MRTTRHSGWIVVFALGVLVSRASRVPLHGAEVPLEDAASQIAAAEARIRNISFKSRMTAITFRADGDPATVKVSSPESAVSRVRWDFVTGRYRASVDSIQRAVTTNDTAPASPLFYGSQSKFAKSSQLLQFWSRGLASESPMVPSESTQIDQSGRQGIIAPAAEEHRRIQNAGFVAVYGMQAGINWLPQLAWSRLSPPQTLSTILLEPPGEGDQTSVDQGENGLWQIHLRRRSTATPYDWTIHYDSIHCRPVRSIWSVMTQAAPEVMTESTRVHFEYPDDTAPCPRRVVLMELLGTPRGYQWEYELLGENEDVSDADFQVSFPPGIEVTDYVRQRNYIVGVTDEDDQAAVERFKEREGLHRGNTVEPKPRNTGWLVAINAAVASLVAIAVIWRRRSGHRGTLPGVE